MSPAINLVSNTQMEEEIMQETLYQKGVKHLCEKGISRVPTKYILPASDRPIRSQTPHNSLGSYNETDLIELPVIDFAQLHGPNRSLVLRSLAHACEHYGFFQLTNHGISNESIEKMVDVSRRFFEQSFEERQKHMSKDMFAPVRYGTSYNQSRDGVFCWRDFLKINCCQPSSDFLHLCPSSPSDLREVVMNYSMQTKLLYLMTMEAILESLGLGTHHQDDNDLDNNDNNDNDNENIDYMDEFRSGSQLLMLNCFPSCPEPNLTLGMPPHSDYGFLTLLLQDEVKGLQIQHKERWVTVDPLPGSFVVNIGDHLEIFSNGRYKSVLHRVMVNSSRLRLSVASLHSVSFKSMVRPAPELIDDRNPRRYKDTDFAAFMDYILSLDHRDKNFIESRKMY